MGRARRNKYQAAEELIPSTFRDHSGGLNLVDNEQNLDITYQVLLDNMYRNATGGLAIRYGTRLFCDITESVDFAMTDADPFEVDFSLSTTTTLFITRPHHGITTGETITFSGFTEDVNGVPFASLNATFTPTIIDEDRFQITIASYTATDGNLVVNLEGFYSLENDTLNGNLIGSTYFNSHLVVVTDEGEIGKVSGAGSLEAVWNEAIARDNQNTTVTFAVTDAQANSSTVFSGALAAFAPFGAVSVVAHNTSAATDGATLASSIQAALRAADGAATHITATWLSDVLTITDAKGRNASGFTLDGGGGAAVISNPVMWSADLTFCSFAEFGGELYICNGVDKPILIDDDFVVNYVQDLGTNSNANVPICRYVCAADDYLLMAGDPLAPNTLYISHKRAGGTWQGDPPPNDATTVDLSKKAGTSIIKGITRFRNLICVTFDDRMIFGQLGVYDPDSDEHVPPFNDVIEQTGAISHKTMITTGDELLVCDNNGVPSVAQAMLTQTLRPKRPSYIVAPGLKADLRRLSEAALEDRVFAVWNRNEDQYMLFIPNDTSKVNTTQTTCWVYTSNPSEKLSHWSKFTGWNWNCGCVSKLNRMFLCDDTRIYVYGTTDDVITADFVNNPDIAEPADGEEIAFAVEWPWVDLNARTKKKKCRKLQLETTGTARFTMKMYVDNIEVDEDGNDNPTLSMQFVGGDSGGYGAGTQPFGGGRRSSDERPWRWKCDFKIAKLAVTGSSRDPLSIISVSLLRINAGA